MSDTTRETDGALYLPDLTYERTGLSEKLRTLLTMAFQEDAETHAEQYMALGRTKSVELKDFLAEQTLRTLKEWMDARDANAAPASHGHEEPSSLSAGGAVTALDRPMVARISSWLEHWWFAWILNDPSYIQALKKGVRPLDGGEEYRRMNER